MLNAHCCAGVCSWRQAAARCGTMCSAVEGKRAPSGRTVGAPRTVAAHSRTRAGRWRPDGQRTPGSAARRTRRAMRSPAGGAGSAACLRSDRDRRLAGHAYVPAHQERPSIARIQRSSAAANWARSTGQTPRRRRIDTETGDRSLRASGDQNRAIARPENRGRQQGVGCSRSVRLEAAARSLTVLRRRA